VTSLLSVLTLRRGTAAGMMAAILLIMYLLNIVAQLQPDLDWLARVSAFRYLNTMALVDQGASPVESLAVFGLVALVGWGAAVAGFARRDLLA
jgi:hypothetical protein